MTDSEKRRIMLIVGVSTALCLFIVVAVIALDLRSLVQTALPDLQAAISGPTFDEDFIDPDEFTLPRHVVMRGQVERGQVVKGTIGMRRMEGWLLTGRAGETYLLDFDPHNGSYSWQMEVYDPDRQWLTFTADSDAGYADFTQLEVTLPEDGTYYVVLRAVGLDGAYSLAIR